ncbi:hypothetical protein IQ265_23245 [Nodosilinea sp. LEGE 06152]|uniref:hypothetical protein n=1 Tax=Nodosilinea sp. LEGE 06152 TaxID=2777966 RepID=UPI00188152C3|nr:hypothetical protein [Nodosilinea sp. LEGE 06152]MBE9159728.1 hypothetical protein [Nodosilinea sp. LEGE 06152]
MTYLRLALTAPARAWAWGQRYPYGAIGYGLILLAGAWLSRPLLVAIAAAAIISGLIAIFKHNY